MPIKPAKEKGQYLGHSFLARFKGKGELNYSEVVSQSFQEQFISVSLLVLTTKNIFYGFLLNLLTFLILCKPH